MSKYFVKLPRNPQMWIVDKGKRTMVANTAERQKHGLLPVHVISEEELEALPIKGQKAGADEVSDELGKG